MGVGHYENFPVASVLCPPRLRPPIEAIYRFARTADDIADEGDAEPAFRLAELHRFRAALERACARGTAGASDDMGTSVATAASGAWPEVFGPLARQVQAFALPAPLLHALLDAFEQDVLNPPYPDRAALLDYCRRSANPVGRLLLHLYGVADEASLAQSDAICTALQLVNFWQDLGVDAPRGRHYVPAADRERHGVTLEDLRERRDTPRTRALVRELCGWAEQLMRAGAPLARRLPGRAGWELRLVVHGGLRILEKIGRAQHASVAVRPRLTATDLPVLLWRALAMPPRPAAAASGASS
ncbi:MAG: squalene synthase HpnC [Rubrivivax sp.]|nr:squalene synthase HpnC [Rubrivivax sp.]